MQEVSIHALLLKLREIMLYLYSISIVFLGAAILLVTGFNLSHDLIPHLIFFAILTAFAELLPVSLPRGGAVTVGFATNYAAILTLGSAGGAWVAAVGGIINGIRRRASGIRFAFNIAQIAIAAATAGRLYQITGGLTAIARPVNILRDYPSLLVCTFAYFLVNSTLVTACISIERRIPFSHIWFMNIKWALTSYLALAPLGILISAVYVAVGVAGTVLFFIPLLLARYSFQQYMNMREVHFGTMRALAAALEAKDEYTRGHSERVAQYATSIARYMRLPEGEIEKVEYTALLHDIGKIGISEDLLNKIGALTENDFAQLKQHAVIGANILNEVRFLRGASDIVRFHHERFDGKGYPMGLKGESIPLASRILAVADAYDAMTSERPYRPAFPPEEAVRRLQASAGKQFDAEIVGLFVEILKKQGIVKG
ncbi:MAG TPA: HD-GYP domain-containing protein [Firmicutes bacterium]|nr:HD-GYP domain-containing protein [Bacillota bacterium]